MKEYWFVPDKWTFYNIGASIKENNGLADWGMTGLKFEVGDIVYIYLTKPYMCIKYKMEVVNKDIPFAETIQKLDYTNDPENFFKNKEYFFRFKLLETYPDGKYTFAGLRENGLALPRQVMRIKRVTLKKYLGIEE